MDEFIKNILKVKQKRNHKIKGSVGTYQIYSALKEQDSTLLKRINSSAFSKLIKLVNTKLVEDMFLGNDINLPYLMGRLELRKYPKKIYLVNNKVKTNLPINWKETLDLWEQDKMARINKTLVRYEHPETFTVIYNKRHARFNNKSFYGFHINRGIKLKLKQQIQEGELDAFLINGNKEYINKTNS